MADLVCYSQPETATPSLRRSGAGELSKPRLRVFSKLMCVFGLLLVFGTVFACFQAIEICSTNLKANFCP
jgi:hypothetical protein